MNSELSSDICLHLTCLVGLAARRKASCLGGSNSASFGRLKLQQDFVQGRALQSSAKHIPDECQI